MNLNKILLILAVAATLGPDFAAVSTWLAGLGVPWVATVAHVFGLLAAACAGLALALPRLRGILATLGLATPAGEVAPAPKGKDSGPTMKIAGFIVILAALSVSACKTTPTNGDDFFQRVVTCTETNTHNTQAGAAVLNCLTSAVGGDYTACLAGLVSAGYWTVDEVACLVRGYATNAATRINSGAPGDTDAAVLERANEWIRSHQVKYRSE